VFDPGSSKFLLFGGRDSADLNDLWAYDPEANAWSRLSPGGETPSARAYAGMVYDPGIGRTMLFGGNSQGNGYLGDTWTYDSAANTWTKVEGDMPSARFACGLVFVPESGGALLFGGADKSDALADTWGYVGQR
jgi:N-acetylneuraminic acid mutarotase